MGRSSVIQFPGQAKIVKPVILKLPWLHPKQREFVDDPHRFVVASCGSKTGKTFGLANWIVREAWNKEQGLFWWCAPVYKQAAIAFKLIGHLLPPGRYRKRASQGEMVYELLYANGKVRSIIDFRSADRPESLRGEGVHGAVIDEAGYWKRDSFISVMTTLTATKGKLRIISTPKGRNWFYEEWAKGWFKEQQEKNPEYRSYQLPTTCNPFIEPEAIETLRRNFTDKQFRQEILAEFLADGAGVFNNITACQRSYLMTRPASPHRRYVMGIDWAKNDDYTVFVVMDAETKKVVHMERFQNLDWNYQIDRALSTAKFWNRASILMDSTGVGDVPFDIIGSVYPNVEAYNIYNSEPKMRLVRTLQLALERGEVQLPVTSGYGDDDPEGRLAEMGGLVEHELMMFSANVTPTGKVQYSAPEGYNDDIVIALALATVKVSEAPFEYGFDQVRGV